MDIKVYYRLGQISALLRTRKAKMIFPQRKYISPRTVPTEGFTYFPMAKAVTPMVRFSGL